MVAASGRRRTGRVMEEKVSKRGERGKMAMGRGAQ
jgi:hypothetical protein